jgi:Uma2 family endonuclease
MSAAVLLAEYDLEIPPDVDDLASFRLWALSDRFPEQGRINFIAGRIEVDMSPDNLYFHSAPKFEIAWAIGSRLRHLDLGECFIDKTRITCPEVSLSVEPDIVFISHDSLASGRVTVNPAADRKSDSFIEIEGPPDLIVEIVSDGSVAKDTRRLRQLYHQAGVTEYWLVDARGEELQFDILRWTERGYDESPAEAVGWQASSVLSAAYQFTRHRNRSGHWQYRLNESTR